MSEAPRILALFGARAFFGQERANIEALVALMAEGCTVLCVIRPEPWPELMAVRAVLDARGLAWVTAPYIDYPVRGWIIHVLLNNPAAYLRGATALRRIAQTFRPTHIHAFNPFYVASFHGVLRDLPIPMIYRAGDRPVRHNLFYRTIWRFIVRRAAHFVADSHFVERELVAAGVDGSRITVLYSPPPRRIAAPLAVIPEPAKQPGAFRFVFVGQMTPDKGVGLAVEAFATIVSKVADAHLLIAGPASSASENSWDGRLRDRVAADPHICHKVHFLGFVEDAPGLIRQCHVHIAPSVSEEAYGLVVVEAKSVGRPSIIFRSGGMTELVEDGVDGAIVDDRTAQALAKAMMDYAIAPLLAEKHGGAALASIAGLNFDAFPRRWRQIYEGAVEGSDARGGQRSRAP